MPGSEMEAAEEGVKHVGTGRQGEVVGVYPGYVGARRAELASRAAEERERGEGG